MLVKNSIFSIFDAIAWLDNDNVTQKTNQM